MPEHVPEPSTFEELRQFVHLSLCATENLLPDQFETRQHPLLAQGKLCGMEYSLQGLRSVRLAAIWAADSNTLYFYDARGERFRKIRLTQRITAPMPAAG